MNKIFLIIRREYLSRVRKKSFLIMTIIGPVLMAAMIILPAYISDWTEATERKVAVMDETGWFFEKFKDQDNVKFYHVYGDFKEEKDSALLNGELFLFIPKTELNIPVNSELYSTMQPGLNVTSYIKSVMKHEVENKKLLASGIDPEIIKSSKVNINLSTIRVEDGGIEKKSNTEVEVGLAAFAGILIYFFIFMFGVQVLKGVMEEKSNRIVEVIISSVKPFQLMLGKIIGVAFVGLTQFLLWILLTLIFVGAFQSGIFTGENDLQIIGQNNELLNNAKDSGISPMVMINEIIGGIDIKVMMFSFIFYFLGGYLLYASLFAAIGGAIDHDTDSQQFMLPVSMPLVFAIALSGVIINQPDSNLAIWMSMIPFTSPITMMMRIPFGVPLWQIWTSVGLLITGFILTTYMASKIYKTGILMYGQKVSYSIIWKWLTNKY
ncbi:MAG: ABC transporter permease [Lentimicrobiaceae bacterium]|jgi:ABC-2 type transport system permease protein|nr:ABC transporter permease [Lentimicrobiaceae bacterium]MCP4909259.1 ABC transporter permease [Bacteroidota bacterium]MBT3454220.1 ABC transporter permease [Lentimicrobiaceae bacterium]MBT3819245.1 ABC transporter permease [Lentimicrobiaceae bacterium]MBT4060380.1 ABC transporter permease [Lentimicrobiaceae bacterium]